MLSFEFKDTNEVKQGGNLSQLLFSPYIDELLCKVKKSGSCCHMNGMFCGALGYADDIILLSPSHAGMRDMLSICQQYAEHHYILFNTKKSHAIVFRGARNKSVQYSPLHLNNEVINYTEQEKHLGHLLNANVSGHVDVSLTASSFNRSVNRLMSDLGSLPSDVLSRLFVQYCCNLYGITLCDMRSRGVERLNVLWRKAIRRIYKIPSRTHNRLLPYIFSKPMLNVLIAKRIVNFLIKLLESEICLVKSLATRCCLQSYSNMGRNVNYINNRCNILAMRTRNAHISQVLNTVTEIFEYYENENANVIDECTGYTCTELINLRDGLSICDSAQVITATEYSQLIEYLCTI